MWLDSSVAESAHETGELRALTQLPSNLATQLPRDAQRPHSSRFFPGASDPAAALAILQRCPDEYRTAAASDNAVRLAQAYVLSRDPAHAEACLATLGAGIQAGPGEQAWTVATGGEAAMHLIEWCWTLALLHSWYGDRLLAAGIESAIIRHAAHLQRCVTQYCPSPAELTSEALGLLYASALFPEHADAAAWRDLAVRTFTAEIQAQVGPDGVHIEQSSCCHRLAVDAYLHFLVLASRNGIAVPPHVPLAVQRMVEFLLAIRQPDGSIPPIGDADGARLVTLSSRPPHDARDTFAIAAALFGRSDFAWAAEGFAPEVAWLTGASGIAAFEAIRPAPPASAPSRVFPSGGYAVMSSGWERDAHHMVVDVGPLGCPVSGGHGHADLLSIQCAIFGEPTLVDPGTHGYSGDSKWRDYFRGTAAHSTVVVDGESQAETSGPYGWRRRPRVRLREWHSTPDFDFLDAEHDGYSRLADPVTHRRRVIFVKPAYWILIDDLVEGTLPPQRSGRPGAARHHVELAFQFGSMEVALEAHPWARAVTKTGQVLWISPFPSAPAQPSLKCGELSPIRGWIAREMGHLSPAPMLIYSFAVALPWRIVTLLLPDRQAAATPPAVRPIYDAGGLPTGFVFDRPRRVVQFDDHEVLVERE